MDHFDVAEEKLAQADMYANCPKSLALCALTHAVLALAENAVMLMPVGSE